MTHEGGEWELARHWAGAWYTPGSDIGAEESIYAWFPITIHDAIRIYPPHHNP